ncbi:MAG: tryptophan synthase subunit alpha, partial [Lachnospiraceae bacterium]|nr:tryptophan synthase subunit alpha [Lachnospiraceae bacterium]
KEQVAKYSGIADGAIVGSAIVKIIARYGEDAGEKLYEYVKEMVSGIPEC